MEDEEYWYPRTCGCGRYILFGEGLTPSTVPPPASPSLHSALPNQEVCTGNSCPSRPADQPSPGASWERSNVWPSTCGRHGTMCRYRNQDHHQLYTATRSNESSLLRCLCLSATDQWCEIFSSDWDGIHGIISLLKMFFTGSILYLYHKLIKQMLKYLFGQLCDVIIGLQSCSWSRVFRVRVGWLVDTSLCFVPHRPHVILCSTMAGHLQNLDK